MAHPLHLQQDLIENGAVTTRRQRYNWSTNIISLLNVHDDVLLILSDGLNKQTNKKSNGRTSQKSSLARLKQIIDS
jgi:hypothetical protein